MTAVPGLVDIAWQGRHIAIEHVFITPERSGRPLLVFLHEGLGSVSMWRDFPERLCAAADCRGLVYSRPGYGRSTPRAEGERWQADFLHRQAFEVLPALLQVLSAEGPLWLLGHSDGGSIALLYATRHALAGCVVLAPHIMVEAVSIASIQRAKDAYAQGDLHERLARHHADPDSAFGGWCGAWLAPAFRSWSIEGEIGAIACPLLALQGSDDEYGTLEQIDGIARRVPQTRTRVLQGAGHSPQRDQPAAVTAAVADFIRGHTRGA